MNQLAAMSLLRSVLIALGSFGVTKGYITEDTLHQAVGALLVIFTALWGYIEKLNTEEPK